MLMCLYLTWYTHKTKFTGRTVSDWLLTQVYAIIKAIEQLSTKAFLHAEADVTSVQDFPTFVYILSATVPPPLYF